MDTLIAPLKKLFVGKVEQVRVADLELAAKRSISDDELWSYHHAKVFKYNYSLVYDFNPRAAAPETITARELTDLEIAAGKIKKVKEKRVAKTKPKVGREKATALAALNGIDVGRYEHLDNGRLAMTINNLLRGREKKGLEVKWHQ